MQHGALHHAQAPAGDAPPLSHGVHDKSNVAVVAQSSQEVYDPYDDWSIRDLLLGLTPFIITYAFKDVALYAAFAVAIFFSGMLILWRATFWDSRTKWKFIPILEVVGLCMFVIMIGLTHHDNLRSESYRWWQRWWPIIAPAVMAFAAFCSLALRIPFTAHYARYPKYAVDGQNLWRQDTSWKRHSDMATAAFAVNFTIMCLLSLIPVMTDNWSGYHVLNIIFNYVVPFLLIMAALLTTWILGQTYKKLNTGATAVSTPNRIDMSPAGPGVVNMGHMGTNPYPAVQPHTGASAV